MSDYPDIPPVRIHSQEEIDAERYTDTDLAIDVLLHDPWENVDFDDEDNRTRIRDVLRFKIGLLADGVVWRWRLLAPRQRFDDWRCARYTRKREAERLRVLGTLDPPEVEEQGDDGTYWISLN